MALSRRGVTCGDGRRPTVLETEGQILLPQSPQYLTPCPSRKPHPPAEWRVLGSASMMAASSVADPSRHGAQEWPHLGKIAMPIHMPPYLVRKLEACDRTPSQARIVSPWTSKRKEFPVSTPVCLAYPRCFTIAAKGSSVIDAGYLEFTRQRRVKSPPVRTAQSLRRSSSGQLLTTSAMTFGSPC